jgi:hypothetical protein
MEKADISTLEKPDISILVLQSDLSFGYLSAELKSPVKIPIPRINMGYSSKSDDAFG